METVIIILIVMFILAMIPIVIKLLKFFVELVLIAIFEYRWISLFVILFILKVIN